jgi:hypothetical protein
LVALFITRYLSQFVALDKRFESVASHLQVSGGHPLPVSELVVMDVVPLILREAIEEHAAVPGPEGGENPKAAASTLPPPWYALLDEATAEIRID